MNPDLLLIAFPAADDEALYWWRVADGAVQGAGCDPDPRAASQTDGPDEAQADIRVVALIASHLTMIMAHEAISDVTDNQALAAASMTAKANSLDSANLHIVATMDDAGAVVTASVGRDILSAGLVRLQALELDPDAIIPSGWLLPGTGDGAVSADFGFDQVIRADNLIATDDPALREILFADQAIVPVTGDAFDAMLAGASEKCDLNFRSGPFAKKTRRAMDARKSGQRRTRARPAAGRREPRQYHVPGSGFGALFRAATGPERIDYPHGLWRERDRVGDIVRCP